MLFSSGEQQLAVFGAGQWIHNETKALQMADWFIVNQHRACVA